MTVRIVLVPQGQEIASEDVLADNESASIEDGWVHVLRNKDGAMRPARSYPAHAVLKVEHRSGRA